MPDHTFPTEDSCFHKESLRYPSIRKLVCPNCQWPRNINTNSIQDLSKEYLQTKSIIIFSHQNWTTDNVVIYFMYGVNDPQITQISKCLILETVAQYQFQKLSVSTSLLDFSSLRESLSRHQRVFPSFQVYKRFFYNNTSLDIFYIRISTKRQLTVSSIRAIYSAVKNILLAVKYPLIRLFYIKQG